MNESLFWFSKTLINCSLCNWLNTNWLIHLFVLFLYICHLVCHFEHTVWCLFAWLKVENILIFYLCFSLCFVLFHLVRGKGFVCVFCVTVYFCVFFVCLWFIWHFQFLKSTTEFSDSFSLPFIVLKLFSSLVREFVQIGIVRKDKA